MQYLPSKKIVTLMIVIVFVGGFWLFLNKNGNLKDKNLAGADALESIAFGGTRPEYKDSDNDGLEDWEEKLFGTDPKNPDSNGDGTLDGEEFASLKSYPEYSPEEIGGILNFGRTSSNSGLFVQSSSNLTDTLTREAAYRYGILSQENGVDENVKNQLASAMAQDLSLSTPSDKYNEEDIVVVNDMGIVVVNSYMANIILLFIDNKIPDEEDPMEIVARLADTYNEEAAEKLSTIQSAYEKFAQDIIELPAPVDLAPLHITLANSFYHMSESIKGMGSVLDDPVKSMLATARFANYRDQQAQIILVLTDYYNRYSLAYAEKNQ